MKIAVLVSGGVDSSVALKLLKDQGHDVTAFYLKIWLEDELSYLGDCPWQEDLSYVRRVCEQLNVPLEVVSLQREYWEHVVAYTINEIKAGRTPNPDILCNSRVKFGFFLDSLSKEYQKVATGHYAQLANIDGSYVLKRSPDEIKDQTYFLSYLNQDQLAKVLFPIGHLTKTEIRTLANTYDLPNKDRKDSQGICFLGKLKFNDFIKHHLGEKPGPLVEFETKRRLGTHRGFWFHTIGQRQGSGLSGGPWYVVAKNPNDNTVFVSRNYYAEDKHRDTFRVIDCNWIGTCPENMDDLQVKIRHGKAMHACSIVRLDDRSVQVKLAENDQGLAPGQFAVFYDGDRCLGSGVIASTS